MDPRFASFVDLIRRSDRDDANGYARCLKVRNSAEIRELLQRIRGWSEPEVRVGGRVCYESLAELADGTELSLRWDDVVSGDFMVLPDLAALLDLRPSHLSHAPANFYLINEDYAPGDAKVPERVAAYLRIPKLIGFLKEAADAEVPKQSRLCLMFLAGKKLEVPVSYGITDLNSVPAEAVIEDFREALASKPHVDQKRELLKRVLIRRLQDVSEAKRFSRLLAGFDDIRKSFSADLDHFLSEFDFEKVREQFGRKRLEYMLKINSTIGDLVSKLLAIPIAQGIVAAQFKADASHTASNVALLAGAIIFTVIGFVLVFGHAHSLREIKREVQKEDDETQKRHPELYDRIKGDYRSIIWRASVFAPIIVALAVGLLLVGIAFTLAAFDHFAPCEGCIRRVPESIGGGALGVWNWVQSVWC